MWSGVTSGLFWAWARSTALRMASWTLSVQRSWSMAIGLPPRPPWCVAVAGAPEHEGLAQRHEVATVVAMGLFAPVPGLVAHAVELGGQSLHLGLELEHVTDPFEV